MQIRRKDLHAHAQGLRVWKQRAVGCEHVAPHFTLRFLILKGTFCYGDIGSANRLGSGPVANQGLLLLRGDKHRPGGGLRQR